MSGRTEVSQVTDQLGDLQLDTRGMVLLPPELQDLILACIQIIEVYKVRPVCKSWQNSILRGTYQQGHARRYPREFSLSPLVFYAKEDSWHFWGYDFKAGIWRTLPPFKKPIPGPDPDLFKDFHIAAHKGLFCVNVGKALEKEELYVCNPLTGEAHKLPPLHFSRHPVVIHVRVTLAKKEEFVTSRYWVIVIGSAAIGTESLSRKTEVFDSAKNKWEVAGDVPGEDFSINDYQTGVYCETLNLLLCVGFMVNGMKGILGFEVEQRKWREDWICPFLQLHPAAEIPLTVHFAIAHLVMCGEKVYLFSEQEAGRNVTHCLDRLDLDSRGGHVWTRVLTRPRQGNRALLVYPEYTCVPVAENKVCIFNTIEKTGVVYDMLNDPVVADTFETLPPPPRETGIMFHSLNPVGYAFEPSFVASALPTKTDDEKVKGEKKGVGKVDVKREDVKGKDVTKEDQRGKDVKEPSGEWPEVLEGEASVVHHEQQVMPDVVDHGQQGMPVVVDHGQLGMPVVVDHGQLGMPGSLDTAPVVDEQHRNRIHGGTRS